MNKDMSKDKKRNTWYRDISEEQIRVRARRRAAAARRHRISSGQHEEAVARIQKNSHRRRRQALISFFRIAGVVTVLLLILNLSPLSWPWNSRSTVVEAQERLSDVHYKEIEIQPGDSLWSIAKENLGPGYDDIYEYIDDIAECNNLHSDRINAGGYLIVPYYEYE